VLLVPVHAAPILDALHEQAAPLAAVVPPLLVYHPELHEQLTVEFPLLDVALVPQLEQELLFFQYPPLHDVRLHPLLVPTQLDPEATEHVIFPETAYAYEIPALLVVQAWTQDEPLTL